MSPEPQFYVTLVKTKIVNTALPSQSWGKKNGLYIIEAGNPTTCITLVVASTHEGGFSGGEWTSSVIKFVPKPEDNGKYIVCKAANEYFASHIKEDGYIINVHCKSKLKLRN